MIEVKNLFLKYIREYYALYDINVNIDNGEKVALVGAEGSGKTTLLRVFAKLEKYEQGEVYIKNINLKKLDFKNDISMGYIPFKTIFFENKTVYENLKYVLETRNVKPYEMEEKINDVLIGYNIEKIRNVKAKDLSLFDRYIVSFARLALRELDLVLIDNIFDIVAEEEKNKLLSIVKQQFAEEKLTLVVAVSKEEYVDFVDRKVFFDNGSIITNKKD